MGRLKSAHELAAERIIASKHKKPEKDDGLGFDFVTDIEYSQDKPESKEEYSKAFLERDDKEEPKEEIREEDLVPIVEPETMHFEDKTPEIIWNGHFLGYDGFSRMNRIMTIGLSNRNVRVKAEIEPHLTQVNEATQKEFERMSNVEVNDNAPKIYGVTIPLNMMHGGKKIIYTMIETSEKVHKDYVGKLNMCDEIWVPTEYGKKILKSSGVHPPIYVMPLGVDVERYKPDAGKIFLGNEIKDFVFLSVFRWSYRKGFDILLKAYMEEFDSSEAVSLLMVSRAVHRLGENGNEQILNDFTGVKDNIDKHEEELPHVALHCKPVSEANMPRIYASSDAFVLISRGEGFGLPYCEAAATGLPVIASNCSGHSDFLKEDNSFLVEPEDYAEAKVGGHLSNMAKLCHFYEGQVFPDFTRKSIEETREQMRYVYEHRKEAHEKAQKLRSLVVNNYSWDMAVERVYDRILELNGD